MCILNSTDVYNKMHVKQLALYWSGLLDDVCISTTKRINCRKRFTFNHLEETMKAIAKQLFRLRQHIGPTCNTRCFKHIRAICHIRSTLIETIS